MKVVVITERVLEKTKIHEVIAAGVFPSFAAAAKWVSRKTDFGPKRTQTLIDDWNNEGDKSIIEKPSGGEHFLLWEAFETVSHDDEGNNLVQE